MADLPTEGSRLYEDALAWMEQRQIVLPDVYYNQLTDLERLRAFSVARVTVLDELASIHSGLMDAIDKGMTQEQWKRQLLSNPEMIETLKLSKARLDNVFRTNVQQAYSMGIARQQESPRALKRRPFFQYDAINDSRTRPAHAAMDNFIARHDDPVWQRWTPICGYRCFLPGTMVRGDFQIGLKSFYSGPAIELRTRSGKSLSVTANHPVLTRRGWLCAKDIQEGDDLLSDQFGINTILPGVVDNEQPPSSVEEVFQSLAGQALGVCHRSSFEFHDDMQFRKGDVYVAGADGLLMDGVFPISNEGIKAKDAIRPDHVSVFPKPESPSLFADLSTDLDGMLACDIVVEVRHFTFSGPVYDFETETGLILASDIVTHNCRCVRLAITEAEAIARGWTGQTKPVPAEPDPGFAIHPLANDGKTGIKLAVEERSNKTGPFWNSPAIQAVLLEVILDLAV